MRWINRLAILTAVVSMCCLVIFRAQIPGVRPDSKRLVVKIGNPNVSDAECMFDLWLYNDYDAVLEYTERDGRRRKDSFLSNAAYAKRIRVVEWLMEKGANPNPPGKSPLHQAIYRRDWRLAATLVGAGANWSTRLDSGETVREWALRSDPKGVETVDSLVRDLQSKR
jgi:hypothetical protein